MKIFKTDRTKFNHIHEFSHRSKHLITNLPIHRLEHRFARLSILLINFPTLTKSKPQIKRHKPQIRFPRSSAIETSCTHKYPFRSYLAPSYLLLHRSNLVPRLNLEMIRSPIVRILSFSLSLSDLFIPMRFSRNCYLLRAPNSSSFPDFHDARWKRERERKGYHGLSRAKPRKVSNAGEISRGGERAINYRRVRN